MEDRAWLQRMDQLRYQDPELALENLREAGDRIETPLLPTYLGVLGSTYRQLIELDQAKECIVLGLRTARDAENQSAMGDLLQRLAYVVGDRGDYGRALDIADRATGIQMRLGDWAGVGRCLADQGMILYYLERFPEAVRALEASLDFLPAEELTNRISVAGNLGLCYQSLGDLPSATRYAKLARDQSSGLSDWWIAKTAWFQGALYRDDRKYREAEQCLQQARSIFKSIHHGETALVTTDLISVKLLLGKPEEALATAHKMFALVDPVDPNEIVSGALAALLRDCSRSLNLAELKLIRCEIEKAREHRSWHSLKVGD